MNERMVDFRVSDGFGAHPRTVGIGLDAAGLWALGGAWCARFLTDGALPEAVAAELSRGRRRPMAELERRGLLVPTGDGWQYRDWAQYQRTREQVEKERERSRKRLAAWRAQQANRDDRDADVTLLHRRS